MAATLPVDNNYTAAVLRKYNDTAAVLRKYNDTAAVLSQCRSYASFSNPPAVVAPSLVPEQAALVADVDVEGVGRDHEPFDEQHARAVRDQTIALHLAESEASFAGSALRRLPGQDSAGTSGSAVHLVQDHVLELLVVDGAVVDVGLQGLAGYARGQHILPLK